MFLRGFQVCRAALCRVKSITALSFSVNSRNALSLLIRTSRRCNQMWSKSSCSLCGICKWLPQGVNSNHCLILAIQILQKTPRAIGGRKSWIVQDERLPAKCSFRSEASYDYWRNDRSFERRKVRWFRTTTVQHENKPIFSSSFVKVQKLRSVSILWVFVGISAIVWIISNFNAIFRFQVPESGRTGGWSDVRINALDGTAWDWHYSNFRRQ